MNKKNTNVIKEPFRAGAIDALLLIVLHLVLNIFLLFTNLISHLFDIFHYSMPLYYLLIFCIYFALGSLVGAIRYRAFENEQNIVCASLITVVIFAFVFCGLYLFVDKYIFGDGALVYLIINPMHIIKNEQSVFISLIIPIMQPLAFVLGGYVQHAVHSRGNKKSKSKRKKIL